MSDTSNPDDRNPDDRNPDARNPDAAGPYGPSMPPEPGEHRQGAKPGVIPLRALEVGDILSGAIATIRRHPALMLGVTAVVVTITSLISLAAAAPLLEDIGRAAAPGGPPLSYDIAGLVGKTLGVAAISVLFVLAGRIFLSGFFTQVVAAAVIGRRVGFRDIWIRVRPRLLPLLGLTLVYLAVAIGAGLVVFVFALAVPPLAVILALAMFVVGIWLVILFSLATAALVLENVGVGAAFGRSRQLVTGSWWRIFGISLLAWIIAFAVSWIVSLPFDAAGGDGITTSAGSVSLSASYLVPTTIGNIVASTLTEPFVAAVTVLLYTDQRIRREGMATELTAAANTPPSPPDAQPPS